MFFLCKIYLILCLVSCPIVSGQSEFQRQKSFGSVTKYEVAQAPNLSVTLPTDYEMRLYIETYRKQSSEIPVGGINFSNESKELVDRFLGLLVIQEDYRRKNSGIDEYNSKAQTYLPPLYESFTKLGVPDNCRNVICSAESIWGKEDGIKILYMNLKYGVNTSPITLDPFKSEKQKAQKWKPGELDVILATLQDVPEHLFPLNLYVDKVSSIDNSFLEIIKKSDKDSGGNDYAKANQPVEIFTTWEDQDPLFKRYVLYHEFSHLIDQNLGKQNFSKNEDLRSYLHYSLSKKWADVSSLKSGKRNSSISFYSETNTLEEMAEMGVACRYDPTTLKSISPQAFSLLSDILRIQQSTEKPSEVDAKWKPLIDKIFGQISLRNGDLCKDEFDNCKPYLTLSDELKVSDNFLRCMIESVVKKELESGKNGDLVKETIATLSSNEGYQVYQSLLKHGYSVFQPVVTELSHQCIKQLKSPYSMGVEITSTKKTFISSLLGDEILSSLLLSKSLCLSENDINCYRQHLTQQLKNLSNNRCYVDLNVTSTFQGITSVYERDLNQVQSSAKNELEQGRNPNCLLYSYYLKKHYESFKFSTTLFGIEDFSKALLLTTSNDDIDETLLLAAIKKLMKK